MFNNLIIKLYIQFRKTVVAFLKLMINLIPVKSKRRYYRECLPVFYKQLNIKKNSVQKESNFLMTTNTSNIGDLYCCPADYFHLSFKQNKYDIVNTFNCDLPVLNKDNLIFGGGIHPWLFSNEKFYRQIKGKNNIAWGIGVYNNALMSDDFMNKFSLIGVREFNHPQIDNKKVFYIPCSSCMLNEFDLNYEVQHEIVFYLHKMLDKNISQNYPCLDNYANDIYEVFKFLASGEVVVSNSYHGVYWATLLGKKVICIPPNDKFFGYKYPPVYANVDNWQDKICEAKSYPEALNDCRKINLDFYQKVKNVIDHL